MGQEIEKVRFKKTDFQQFEQRLRDETAQLASWFAEGSLCTHADTIGFELEAWIIGPDMQPAGLNAELIAGCNNPDVVPELAAFNIEFNNRPHALNDGVFSCFHRELSDTLQRTQAVAAELDSQILLCGILPTVEQKDLCMDSMSIMQRYRALNEQVLRMRDGRPLKLDIRGRDHLQVEHGDVMLEAATTSFQLHMKVSPDKAARIYNLSKIISAPIVGCAANSPYLFGHELWDETRIPLFEQAVDVGETDFTRRVSYGIRYVHESLMECFDANLDRYPILIPMLQEDDGTLPHLRLHNGTVWRWNRPLIGFNDDGTPHLRIEHRTVPSGPTATDSIANAAFFFGLIHGLLEERPRIDQRVTFEMSRSNFYAAARLGLDADVVWDQGEQMPLRDLILEELLPIAERGLKHVGVGPVETNCWLGVIHDRVASGINGARWQRHWVREHGNDRHRLTRAYAERSLTGKPVHEWDWSL